MSNKPKPASIFAALLGVVGLASASIEAWALPVITTPPVTRTVVNESSSFSLNVAATGSGSIGYQWYRNNREIPGATSATYSDNEAFYADAGAYTVVVSDSEGATRATGFINVAIAARAKIVAWGYNGNGQTDVPSGVEDVTAIAAGSYHSLALKADGTVVAWGYNGNGQTNVPSGLADVTAIAAGSSHSLALKADGTVVAWGYNWNGLTNFPEGLNDVTAIAAGSYHSLALKADGTVVAWGRNWDGQTAVPTGLEGVTALAAGYSHSLALKGDGTVVAWGANWDGQTDVPTGLEGVTAIAAGDYHSLALKADGTLVAWGRNWDGQTAVPTGLSDAVAISAGDYHNLVLFTEIAPFLTTPPANVSVPIGSGFTLGVSASGNPLNYQWFRNGEAMEGATNATYEIFTSNIYDAGVYSVKVSNSLGEVTSAAAAVNVTTTDKLGKAEDAYDLLYGYAYTIALNRLDNYITANPSAVDLPLARVLRGLARIGIFADTTLPDFLKAKLGAERAELSDLVFGTEEHIRFPLGFRDDSPSLWQTQASPWTLPGSRQNNGEEAEVPDQNILIKNSSLLNPRTFILDITGGSAGVSGTFEVGSTFNIDRVRGRFFKDPVLGVDYRHYEELDAGDADSFKSTADQELQVTLLPGEWLELSFDYWQDGLTVSWGAKPSPDLEVRLAGSVSEVPAFKPGSNLTDLFTLLRQLDLVVIDAILADLNAIPSNAEIRLAAGDIGSVHDLIIAGPERELLKASIKIVKAFRLLSDTYDFGVDLSEAVFQTDSGDEFLTKHPKFLSALANASPATRIQAKALLNAAVEDYRGVESTLWSRPSRTDGAQYLVTISPDLAIAEANQYRAEISKALGRFLALLDGPTSFDDYINEYSNSRDGIFLPSGARFTLAPFFAAQPVDIRSLLPASEAGFRMISPGAFDGLITAGFVSGLSPGQVDETIVSILPGLNFLFGEVARSDWESAAGFTVQDVVRLPRHEAIPSLGTTPTHVIVASQMISDENLSSYSYRVARLNLGADGVWSKAWELNDLAENPAEFAIQLGGDVMLYRRQVISTKTGEVVGEVAGAPVDWIPSSDIYAIPGAYLINGQILTEEENGFYRLHALTDLPEAVREGYYFIGLASGFTSTITSTSEPTLIMTNGQDMVHSIRWDGYQWTKIWSKDMSTDNGYSYFDAKLLSAEHWIANGRIFSVATGDELTPDGNEPAFSSSSDYISSVNGFYVDSAYENDIFGAVAQGPEGRLQAISPSAIQSVLEESLSQSEELNENRRISAIPYAFNFSAPGLGATEKFILVKYGVREYYDESNWYWDDYTCLARLDWDGNKFTMRWTLDLGEDYYGYGDEGFFILDSRYFVSREGFHSLATGRVVADAYDFAGFDDDYMYNYYYEGLAPSDLRPIGGNLIGGWEMNSVVLYSRSQLAATPPVITIPLAETAALVGTSVELSVGASGDGLSYQWFKGNYPIPDATASTLKVLIASAADFTDYSVRVRNTSGLVSSSAAIVPMAAPTITTQPAAQSVPLGQIASFSVATSGGGLTYQWKVSGQPIAGATSASYVFTTTAESSGLYSVTVTNAAGSVTSNAAVLTVIVPPVITTQSTAQTVNQGQSVTLTAAASGTGPSYQWFLNGNAIAGATSASYTVTASAATAGTYTVTASNAAGSVTSNAAVLTVIVPPVITTQPTAQTVDAGQTVTFTTAFSGTASNYQWFLNGTPISGATSATYSVFARTGLQGSYTVTASNAAGSATSSPAVLTVIDKPIYRPDQTTANQSAVKPLKSTQTFSVTAEGNGLKYQWSLNGKPIKGATSSTYSPAVSAKTAGKYTLEITDAAGNKTVIGDNPGEPQMTLAVLAKPSVKSINGPTKAKAGDSATFSASASGEQLSYQWRLNGAAIAGANSASLTLGSLSAANAGSYTVTVSNAAGTGTSKAVKLAIVAPAVITRQPSGSSTTVNGAFNLSVAATSTKESGKVAYQWYLNGSPIAKANKAAYAVKKATTAQAGVYTVVVSNAAGSVTSAPAVVTVQ